MTILPIRPKSTPKNAKTTETQWARICLGIESRLYLSNILPTANKDMTPKKATLYIPDNVVTLPNTIAYNELVIAKNPMIIQ